jgi:hypothetical protein
LCYMPCPSYPPWLDHSNYTWRNLLYTNENEIWSIQSRITPPFSVFQNHLLVSPCSVVCPQEILNGYNKKYGKTHKGSYWNFFSVEQLTEFNGHVTLLTCIKVTSTNCWSFDKFCWILTLLTITIHKLNIKAGRLWILWTDTLTMFANSSHYHQSWWVQIVPCPLSLADTIKLPYSLVHECKVLTLFI